MIGAFPGTSAASIGLSPQSGSETKTPLPQDFNSEVQAASFTRARIAKEAVLHADEAASWDNGHERFEIKRSNHQEAYRLDGACADLAEEYFPRLRRPPIGIPQNKRSPVESSAVSVGLKMILDPERCPTVTV